jgi:hypothetical protein
MNDVYIYSTLSQDINFAFYKPKGEHLVNLHEIVKTIYIRGGAGVASRITGKTPKAVATKISSEDFRLLDKGLTGKEGRHPTFAHYIDKGFIIVHHAKEKVAKVAKDMTEKDFSAQRTKEDCVKQGLTVME